MRFLFKRLSIFLFLTVVSSSCYAQYFDLGVSPSSIKWNRINTKHNKYVFAQGSESPAIRMMHYLDTIRPYISYGFSHSPMRFPVVMKPQNFASNGLVMLAPKRMELIQTPNIDAFSEPWLKQLATHEYRHAVQFSNVNRNVIKALSYVIGQQGSLLGAALLPLWFMEGDATLAETQFSSYGRGLQPSFSIECRAMIDRIANSRASQIDKWFCGSYKDFIPDHYKIGYQIVSYAYTHYGENIWDKVARYGSSYPFLIMTTSIALNKYYDTSSDRLFKATFNDLNKFWSSLPASANSSTYIPSPISSYTTYSSPMSINATKLLALKEDMCDYSRIVEVDIASGSERMLFHTGLVSTKPTRDFLGRVFWTEYRTSTFWDQRVNSQLCYFDSSTDNRIKQVKPRTVRSQRQVLYPVGLPNGDVAMIRYAYSGHYSLILLDSTFAERETIYTFPATTSIHSLAYDNHTERFYCIALSDSGMSIVSVSPQGETSTVKESAYVSLSHLKAQSGMLYFHSISSGKDESHVMNLTDGREYQASVSRYGSFDPSPSSDRRTLLMTTYDSDGYKLATQSLDTDSLREVLYTKIPRNQINPERLKWDVPNIDTITVSEQTDRPIKRYRKGLNLINVHSWAPVSFNPEAIVSERKLNMDIGTTLISQNLLNSAMGHFGYAWTEHGSTVRGGFTYNGFAPKIEINAEYSNDGQLIYTWDGIDADIHRPKSKGYFDITADVYLPIMLSSGYHARLLRPAVSFEHNNALLYDPTTKKYDNSMQKMTASLQYIENVRMSTRDLQPQFGYAVRLSTTFNPISDHFSKIWSIYGRGYLPGFATNHGIMLRAAYQAQSEAIYYYRQKELFPRGGEYNFTTSHYAAASFDYRFPVCYPDWGLASIIYFKRISVDLGFDMARYRKVYYTHNQTLYSYGAELTFDLNLLRTPALATTTFSISVFKPSDSNKPAIGINFQIPL